MIVLCVAFNRLLSARRIDGNAGTTNTHARIDWASHQTAPRPVATPATASASFPGHTSVSGPRPFALLSATAAKMRARVVLLLALPRWGSATFTTGGQMTFAQCESYCAAMGSEVACVASDADQTELEGLTSGSCSEFWVASEARATRGPRARCSRLTPPLCAPPPPMLSVVRRRVSSLARAPCAGLQRLG